MEKRFHVGRVPRVVEACWIRRKAPYRWQGALADLAGEVRHAQARLSHGAQKVVDLREVACREVAQCRQMGEQAKDLHHRGKHQNAERGGVCWRGQVHW